jgi:predicted O-methyltransferase YrrM
MTTLTTVTTLTTPPVSTLLTELFAEDDAMRTLREREFGELPAEARDAVMSLAHTDFRAFYARAKDVPLAVSRETGTLLYLLARACQAKTIVEFGTSFGLSTLHLAAALRDNGGGRVIGSEFEPSKVARARQTIAAAGLSDLVEIREGDALDTFAHDMPETIDLVLLDGAKVLYPSVLALLEPRLRTGALIIADNADDSPEYLAHVRAAGSGYLSVPFADDVELSISVERR